MAEPDASSGEHEVPRAEELWHDKLLGDAVGYTKGLVTLLDTLSEGFRRRGRDLEELRHRLLILQSERRTFQEERTNREAQIGALSAECDGLRQELTQGQAALEARAREIQALEAADKDARRQAEELREIVRSLERQLGRDRPSTMRHLPPAWSAERIAPADVSGTSTGAAAESPKGESAGTGWARPRDPAFGADRNQLQSALDERDRELATLRREMVQAQAVLAARTQKLEEEQQRKSEALHEMEHLQAVIEGLEREKEDAIRQHAARLGAAAPGQAERPPQPAGTATQKIPHPPAHPAPSPKISSYRNPIAGVTVECVLETTGAETTRILRGEMSQLNAMGMMGVFDERLAEGRRVLVRFALGEEELSCHGRLLRVRSSRTVPAGLPVFDHLIRFDAPISRLPD